MVRVWVGLGWPAKNTGRVTSQPVFALGQKNQVQVKYFLGRVKLGQKILTRFDMSNGHT